MNKKSVWLRLLVIASLLMIALAACGGDDDDDATPEATPEPESAYADSKIVFVDSYHEGYTWSDGLTESITETLDGTGVELKVIHMDTKNNPGEEFGEQAAAEAKAEIDEFGPDVIIACDDNAQRYLVVPEYRGGETPVVFCGVNWDATKYEYPASNVTGMVEVDALPLLLDLLEPYADGETVGFLAPDNESERGIAEAYKRLFLPDMVERYETTYEGFKEGFLAIQDEVDILLVVNLDGLSGVDEEDAKTFFVENTRIPTGTLNVWMADYVLMALARVSAEQGRWAAETALAILDGTPVSDIPLTQNEQGDLMVNLDVAEQLDVAIPVDVLRNATTIGGNGAADE